MLEFIPLSYYALSGLLNFITSIVLSIFVFLKNPKSRTNQTFSVSAFMVAGWSLFYFLWLTTEKSYQAEFYLRTCMIGVIFIPPAFTHFISTLLKVNLNKRTILGNYFISLLLGSMVYTQLFAKEIGPFLVFPYWLRPGPLFHIHLIHFLVNITYSHFLLLKAIRYNSGIFKNQILYVFIGTSIGYISGVIHYLTWYRIPIPPFLNPLVSFYVGFVTYAILRYHLMDITVVIHKGLAYGLLLSGIFIPTYLFVIISQRATFYSIPPFLAGTVIFACGLWILFKNLRSVTNTTFSLVCLGVCTWLFGSFMMYSTTNDKESFFWAKFSKTGVIYIPAFFYHFCESFLQRRVGKKVIIGNYLISTIFLALIPTSYLLNGQYSYFWGYYPKAGILHPLFLVYFFSLSGLALKNLYHGYKTKEEVDPLEAKRIKYVFWAFIIGYIAAIDNIQLYGLEFYPAGYIFVTLWTIIVTYAVAKYRVMDVSLIITKTKVLPYIQALVVIPFYLIILMLIRVFTGSMEHLLAWILLATFVILAGFIANLQKRMEKIIEKTLFRERYDAYETLTGSARPWPLSLT